MAVHGLPAGFRLALVAETPELIAVYDAVLLEAGCCGIEAKRLLTERHSCWMLAARAMRAFIWTPRRADELGIGGELCAISSLCASKPFLISGVASTAVVSVASFPITSGGVPALTESSLYIVGAPASAVVTIKTNRVIGPLADHEALLR